MGYGGTCHYEGNGTPRPFWPLATCHRSSGWKTLPQLWAQPPVAWACPDGPSPSGWTIPQSSVQIEGDSTWVTAVELKTICLSQGQLWKIDCNMMEPFQNHSKYWRIFSTKITLLIYMQQVLSSSSYRTNPKICTYPKHCSNMMHIAWNQCMADPLVGTLWASNN